MRTKWWVLIAASVLVLLGLVFGFPLTHSPRYEALEPHMRQARSLPEFKKLAAWHDLPHEVSEEEDRVVVTFPLDGSKTGQSLLVRFDRFGGITGAGIKDRSGKESQCLCVRR